MTASVRRAAPADVPAVTALLVDALSRDPVAEWLVPDADRRADVLHRLLAVDVDHAIETGHVDVTATGPRSQCGGATTWTRNNGRSATTT
ncbi:hypothetical protein [Micromonospora chersina]|uniref:hypothetical protein n=1 Tax=Micromonospora chersina TaxID=47854 RepID=UPI00369B80A9